jgi:hypothetical protein
MTGDARANPGRPAPGLMSTVSSHPFGITRKQDGTLWFTEQNGDKLGKVVV